jgi:hypothetical protein
MYREKLKELINEKTLLSSLGHQEHNNIQRLKEIDLEIKELFNSLDSYRERFEMFKQLTIIE